MELIYSNNNMLHSMWLKVVFFSPSEWCYNVPYRGSAVKHSAAPFTVAQSK